MMRLHIISEVSVADQQLMEACRPKRERKASLKGKEAAEQEPYNQEEAGSRSGKRVAGSRLFVLSWWLSLFRSFFCFCESLDLCCAGVVTPRRMQHTKTKSTAVRADRTSDNKRASLTRRFQNFPFALFLMHFQRRVVIAMPAGSFIATCVSTIFMSNNVTALTCSLSFDALSLISCDAASRSGKSRGAGKAVPARLRI